MTKKQIDLLGKKRQISKESKKTELKIKRKLLPTPDVFTEEYKTYLQEVLKLIREDFLSLDLISEMINFKIIPLKEIYLIYEFIDDPDDNLLLFCRIVDSFDLSTCLNDLLSILEHFPKLSEWDIEFARCDAFEYLFDAVLKSGTMLERFPEILEKLERFKYGFGEYRLFSYMIYQIKDTIVFRKHISLISSKYANLLMKYEDYPEYPGYNKDFNKKDKLYPHLAEIESYFDEQEVWRMDF